MNKSRCGACSGRIGRLTPFFETCNVAYGRDGFDSAGGFEDDDPLLNREGGFAFGEDAVLAWRVLRDGGVAAFTQDAVVHHRCIQRSFRDHLRAQRNVGGFPGLARRTPIVSRWLKGGIFLNKRSAAFDGAVLATAALSFIGLGAQPPSPEWGTMISGARTYFREAWWFITFPGLALSLTVVGFNLLGDGLRDYFDPRTRSR
jgi:hypothetical protein